MMLVVAGGVVGIGGKIVSVAFRLQAAGFANSAGSAFVAQKPLQAASLVEKFAERVESAVKAQSIQEFSEIAVLLILIAAFVVVGVMCARRVNSSLALMTALAGAKAKYLRRQIVVTVVVVFVTFLLRSTYTSMIAIASALQDSGRYCASICSTLPQEFIVLPPPFQHVHTHVLLSFLFPRVSATRCSDILPPCAAGCAVGHDQRPHAACDEGKQEADGVDTQRDAAG